MKSTRYYKRRIIWQLVNFCALVAIGIAFSACSKGGDSPTTPTLPNSFTIVSIQNYGDDLAYYGVNVSFTNNTKDTAKLTGTLYYGDGASTKVEEITTNPAGWILTTSGSVEIGRFNHEYASLGTYRVKAEFTVVFSNESITRTMEQDFTFTW